MSPWKWTGLVDLLPFWPRRTLLLVAKAANLGVIPDSSLFFTAHGISNSWHIQPTAYPAHGISISRSWQPQWNISSIWPLPPSDTPLQSGCHFLPPSQSLCFYSCQSLLSPLPHPSAAKKRLFCTQSIMILVTKKNKEKNNQTDHKFPSRTPLPRQFSVTLRTPFELSRSWPTGSISHGNTPGHIFILYPTFPFQPHSLVLFYELPQTIQSQGHLHWLNFRPVILLPQYSPGPLLFITPGLFWPPVWSNMSLSHIRTISNIPPEFVFLYTTYCHRWSSCFFANSCLISLPQH